MTGVPPNHANTAFHFHLNPACFPIICPLELKAVIQVEERGCDVPVVAEAKVIRFFLSIS